MSPMMDHTRTGSRKIEMLFNHAEIDGNRWSLEGVKKTQYKNVKVTVSVKPSAGRCGGFNTCGQ